MTEEAITVEDPTNPQRQSIRPAPVPTLYEVGGVANDAGQVMVVLTIQTPAGTTFSFMDAATAVGVGNALRAEGKAALSQKSASGLTLPPGLLVPPSAVEG